METIEMPNGANGGPVLEASHHPEGGGGGRGCVHHLLIAQARRTPHAIAVSFEDGSALSYQELDMR